jgi:hypothetical protein
MNTPKKLPRVTDVEVFGARLFRLTFTDGLVRVHLGAAGIGLGA